MADAIISDLSAAVSLAGADLFEIEQGVNPTNSSKKATLTQIRDFVASSLPKAVVTVTTKVASATLALSDGDWLEMNVAGANTLTVPPNSTVAFPIGTVINVHQYGAGQTTIVQGAGVTVRTPLTLKLRVQYSTAVLVKRATNEWVLAGDIATS